jgi:hypothetical protein|tara:strand:+ start:259 stop:372 length:114 start_codon:yes stop_codon:yes gene_type:complete
MISKEQKLKNEEKLKVFLKEIKKKSNARKNTISKGHK